MTEPLINRVKALRTGRGWSQDELARRTGIGRSSVGAIEAGRLVPSTKAALALAQAFACHVEEIFRLPDHESPSPVWAWQPRREPCRFWEADVQGRRRLYPSEPTAAGMLPHDGVFHTGTFRSTKDCDPRATLVMACCDPAVGLLADELNRHWGVRLIPLQRSSNQALALLRERTIHVAGVHLAEAGATSGNADIVAPALGTSFACLHVARWEEGVSLSPGSGVRSVAAAVKRRLRWVGRELGSAARQCLDELLSGRRAPRRLARDHRGVAEAIRCGWADAGVCLRVVGEENCLDFLSVRTEEYDLCFPDTLQDDWRIHALIETVRSTSYRRLIDELPGYDASSAGELETRVVDSNSSGHFASEHCE